MTADVELLPLPSVLLNWPHPTNHVAIRDYARANVEHHTEALRAHRDRLTLHVLDLEADRSALIGACDEYRQRAERLAEALREARQMIRDLLPDATFTKWDALLRDQEEGK